MTAVHHIAWGPRLDFTYGPLGFLAVRTLYFGSTAAWALAYQFLVVFALFALLIRFTRSTLPLLLASIVSFTIGATAVALIDAGDLLIAPTFLLGILALRQDQPGRRRLLIALLAALSAVGFLIKFGDGLVPLGIVVVLVAVGWGRGRIWDLAVAGSSFVFVLIVAWSATGNRLGDLPDYFKYSASIANGYSSSMQLESGRTDEWWYGAIVLALIAVLAAMSLRQASRRETLGTAFVLAGYSWWAFKEGFVRHDGHDLVFFGSIFVAFAIVRVTSAHFRPVFLAIVFFVGVLAWTALGTVPSNLLALSADTHAFVHQIRNVVDGPVRSQTINDARVQMQASYGLSSKMISELQDRTVAIEPSENSVAWAYPAIRWDPEPVIQSYSAYTSTLDTLDARFIDSKNAPSRILEQTPTAIDGRNPTFESPSAYVAVICHYVQLDASSSWQVLGRVPNRCGSEHLIDRQEATFGQKVKVPEVDAGQMVLARIQSLPLTTSYKAASAILKPAIMSMQTPAATYRFIVGTADDLHLMRPASSTGSSPPFLPSAISEFSLIGGGVQPGAAHYVVSFYSSRVTAG